MFSDSLRYHSFPIKWYTVIGTPILLKKKNYFLLSSKYGSHSYLFPSYVWLLNNEHWADRKEGTCFWQASVLHILYLLLNPKQNSPPYEGTGWSHFLSDIDTPAPQVLEHSLQGPHSPQPPSTGAGGSIISTHLWFWHH